MGWKWVEFVEVLEIARMRLKPHLPNLALAFASKAAAPPSMPRVMAVLSMTTVTGTVAHEVPAGHAVHEESSM